MFQRQQRLFFTLLFSSLLFSFLYSQEIIEDGCDCYKPKPNTNYTPTLSVGLQRPGLSFTKAPASGLLGDPVADVAYVRAFYNYPTDYTFICDRYFYGISNSNYNTYLSKDEYQEVAKESQGLWALHETRTGPHIRYFSDFQSLFEYAENWVDLHYRAETKVYKNFAAERYFSDDERLQNNLDGNAKRKACYFERIDQDRQYVALAFEKLHENCMAKHSCLRTLHDSAFLHTAQGNTQRAIQASYELIELSKRRGSQKYLSADTYQQLGIQCALAHEFSQAIEALTLAIEKDPSNKDTYLERATCYFEMGKFDLAVQDYIASGIEVSLVPVLPQEISYYDFSQGMVNGSWKGMKEGANSIPGSLLQSVHGAGHLLWACVKDPIGAPRDMVRAAIEVIECIRAQDLKAIVHLLAPEICELVRDWDKLGSYMRGEKMGIILGKYGVEIFSRSFITRLSGVAQKLKRINLACNIKAITLSGNNKAGILAQAQITARRREQYLHTKSYQYQKLKAENGLNKVGEVTQPKLSEVSLQNLAIKRECYFGSIRMHGDSQGKHFKEHPNYKNLLENERNKKSLWTAGEVKAEKMLKQHAGKGKPKRGTPCEPGYQEIVDCGEVIGTHMSEHPDPITRQHIPTPTQYAVIHYRKDGYAHMAPVSPTVWEKYSK